MIATVTKRSKIGWIPAQIAQSMLDMPPMRMKFRQ
jgi:hypothetical protein